MENDRAAAKRRASFGRADRLRKEAQQKAAQTKIDERRKAERDKVDQQRKAEAVKAAELRVAQARKRAEQRRLERKRDNLKTEFARKAADRRVQTPVAVKVVEQKRAVEPDLFRHAAAAYVAQQEKRQQADQKDEHRRQTTRLRAEHQTQRSSFGNQRAAGIVFHAQKIKNIDLAEQRELNAFDNQRNSLKGRVTELIRGSKHFDRQERAIVERHENDRWAKHREHEARQDRLFWNEQKTRLHQVADRMAMAKDHGAERQQLTQTHARTRAQQIDARAQAMNKAINHQRQQQQEHKRPREAFGQAAGHSLEIRR